MASGANLLMNMFGRAQGIIGRLGGVIMARMNADCSVWVAGLLEVTPDGNTPTWRVLLPHGWCRTARSHAHTIVGC
jgi:hypothetical protein